VEVAGDRLTSFVERQGVDEHQGRQVVQVVVPSGEDQPVDQPVVLDRDRVVPGLVHLAVAIEQHQVHLLGLVPASRGGQVGPVRGQDLDEANALASREDHEPGRADRGGRKREEKRAQKEDHDRVLLYWW